MSLRNIQEENSGHLEFLKAALHRRTSERMSKRTHFIFQHILDYAAMPGVADSRPADEDIITPIGGDTETGIELAGGTTSECSVHGG